MAQLEAGLREAIKHCGIDDRTAAGHALGAVLEFLYSQGHLTRGNLHRPLYELLAALEDLKQGRVAPMLKPVTFGNRPPDGATLRQAIGFAVFAVEQLVERGDSKTAACRKVSQVWNKEAPHVSRTPETIRSWSNRSSQFPDDDPATLTLTAFRKAAQQNTRVQCSDVLATLSGILKTATAMIGE